MEYGENSLSFQECSVKTGFLKIVLFSFVAMCHNKSEHSAEINLSLSVTNASVNT